MADTFDILKDAASAPSLHRLTVMLACVEDLFAKLAADFPENATFQTRLAVIHEAKVIFDMLDGNDPSAADLASATIQAQALFRDAGIKDVELAQWGLA